MHSLRLIVTPRPEQRDDADLVLALQAAEPWAAEAIWDRHSDRVTKFLARSLGRSLHDVEDLTQEVFLRVFTRPDAIQKPAALRQFLISIAVNVLKWEFRYRSIRRKVRLSQTGEVPDVATAPGFDEAASEARHALKLCYEILDRLGARERVAFVLRYMEEMTVGEVAERMRISVSTAKRLIGRAVRKVSERVAKMPDLRGYFLGMGTRGGDDT
jgi:RNA polymerase sigma-70 factor (ECF subfamily)